MDARVNERDNILQTEAAKNLGDEGHDIAKAKKIHEQIEVEISPTATVSAAGEIAQGALGGFSFEELIGQDVIVYKQK
ncbi:MAG: hypothetical protein ACE3JP_11890 [Ectobacillus sp.]